MEKFKKVYKGKKFTAVFTNENDYFSFTGDVDGGAGACGDKLVELNKDFTPLNKLHLCDEKGTPMHAWANAEYHVKQGGNGRDALHLDTEDKDEERLYISWETAFRANYVKSTEDTQSNLEAAMDDIKELWLERVEDLGDILEDLDYNFSPINQDYFVDPVDAEGNIHPCFDDVSDDELERRTALARHLDCPVSDVEVSGYDEKRLEAQGKDWLVVTDDEADDLWDKDLENYIDECMEIPDSLMPYFDREKWKSDARIDGRGHSLGRYDGNEYVSKGIKETYYIYRQLGSAAKAALLF